MATCFHFRAGWREGCTGCKPADHLCAFADSIGWWPAALKVTIPRGVTEQQALFEALERGGPHLGETMRMAMAEVIDRLAVAAAKELMPQVATLNREIEAMQTSRLWRLTAPLQALSRVRPKRQSV